MTNLQKEVILTFASCGMNVSKTSRKMYIHRNSIMYHLNKIKENTGLDPQDFYDLIVLVKIAEVVTDGTS